MPSTTSSSGVGPKSNATPRGSSWNALEAQATLKPPRLPPNCSTANSSSSGKRARSRRNGRGCERNAKSSWPRSSTFRQRRRNWSGSASNWTGRPPNARASRSEIRKRKRSIDEERERLQADCERAGDPSCKAGRACRRAHGARRPFAVAAVEARRGAGGTPDPERGNRQGGRRPPRDVRADQAGKDPAPHAAGRAANAARGISRPGRRARGGAPSAPERSGAARPGRRAGGRRAGRTSSSGSRRSTSATRRSKLAKRRWPNGRRRSTPRLSAITDRKRPWPKSGPKSRNSIASSMTAAGNSTRKRPRSKPRPRASRPIWPASRPNETSCRPQTTTSATSASPWNRPGSTWSTIARKHARPSSSSNATRRSMPSCTRNTKPISERSRLHARKRKRPGRSCGSKTRSSSPPASFSWRRGRKSPKKRPTSTRP